MLLNVDEWGWYLNNELSAANLPIGNVDGMQYRSSEKVPFPEGTDGVYTHGSDEVCIAWKEKLSDDQEKLAAQVVSDHDPTKPPPEEEQGKADRAALVALLADPDERWRLLARCALRE